VLCVAGAAGAATGCSRCSGLHFAGALARGVHTRSPSLEDVLERVGDRVCQDRDPDAAVVVAALDAHVLRLVVAERALRVARAAVGMDQCIQVERRNAVLLHDL
jgi:hypothetical protein